MAETTPVRPIIVKRIKKIAAAHHGGAWKIAYADFVTAMMAFFLLLWLISSVEKSTREGIAEYFKTPLRTAVGGKSTAAESTLIMKGGGKDPTAASGQVKKNPPIEPPMVDKARQAAQDRRDVAEMRELKERLEKLIKANPKLLPYRNQLLIDISNLGLRIQIVDEKNRPMFVISSSEMQAHTREIIKEMAPLIDSLPNKISIAGHTDLTPYAASKTNYSNWELSSDRANNARRVLLGAGVKEEKLMRVIGMASSVMLDPDNSFNPINRRISIILLNKQAEIAAASEGRLGTTELSAR